MEKSVLLDAIANCRKEFNEVYNICTIFDLKDEIADKLDNVAAKLRGNEVYVAETNIKKETIDKQYEVYQEAQKVIEEGKKAVKRLLVKVVPGIVKGTDNETLEAIITKNTNGYADTLKQLMNAKKTNTAFNKKVITALDKYRNNSSLTIEQDELIILLNACIIKAYMNDAKIEDEANRLSPLPLANDKEETVINNVADKLNSLLTSKRTKKTTKTNNQTKKVEKVEKPQEEDKERANIIKRALIALGILGLATIIIVAAKSCSNKKNNTPEDTEPIRIEDTEDLTLVVDEIPTFNINDEASLDKYAEYIQKELIKVNIEKSTDEIKNAIKLVNVDYLEAAPFDSREDVYTATENAGIIAKELGTDKVVVEDPSTDQYINDNTLDNMIINVANGLSKEDLKLTNTEKGYSIYELANNISNIINDKTNTYSYETKQNAAKLLNEILARKVRSFTLTPDSTLGQYYLLLGMYEANRSNVIELTAGRLWGPIYGDGNQIDGTYGFICVEELQNYTKIGNQDNAFYTIYADLMVKSLTKSLN